MPLQLFEFVEHFMAGFFYDKVKQIRTELKKKSESSREK